MTAPPPGDLTDATVQWLGALLDSASPDTIGAANWWPRATAALTTAAETCDTYGHAVDLAAGKLQIEVLNDTSAKALKALEPVIGPHLDEWSADIGREAVYLVALCRLARSERTAARKAAKAHTAPDEETGF